MTFNHKRGTSKNVGYKTINYLMKRKLIDIVKEKNYCVFFTQSTINFPCSPKKGLSSVCVLNSVRSFYYNSFIFGWEGAGLGREGAGWGLGRAFSLWKIARQEQ